MRTQLRYVVSCGIILCLSGRTFSQGITIEQAIREVCTNSDSTKMMRQTIRKSEENVKQGWSHAYPTVSVSASAVESRASLFGSSGSGSSSGSNAETDVGSAENASTIAKQVKQQAQVTGAASQSFDSVAELYSILSELSKPITSLTYSTSLNVTQPIYTFGKIGTAIKIAHQYDQSTRNNYTREIQTLQLAAFDAFSNAVIAKKKGDIAENAVARKKEVNAFQERNFELGSGSRQQILAVKSDVAQQNATAIIARRDAFTARMNLNSFMGRSLTDSTPLDTAALPAALVSAPLPQADEAVKTALADRKDLKALRLISEANKNGAKIYRANYLPSISALGSVGYSKFNTSESLFKDAPGTTNWTVGLGAQWTLFDGFSSSSKAAQYLSNAEKYDILYNQVTKGVEIEIRSAIAECNAADSNFAASEESFHSAQESYDLTNSDFKQGSGKFADLLLADETLQQAELGLTNAQYRRLRSRAALLVAMGKDIVTIHQEEP